MDTWSSITQHPQSKSWQTSRKKNYSQAITIQPGDSGIWVTCVKGREGKCVAEVRDLFTTYADVLYPGTLPTTDNAPESDNIELDIEAELASMRTPQQEKKQLFTSVKLEVQCGGSFVYDNVSLQALIDRHSALFFKTIAPVEPVSFVQKICQDASEGKLLVKTRFAQRLTPMTVMGRASPDGLDEVAKEVLAPFFHNEPVEPRKVRV